MKLPYQDRKYIKGFSLIELTVVMGIVATLLGLIALNFVNITHKTTLNTQITTIISDIKNQQSKAMTGDTQATGGTNAYGVYFLPTSYVLFKGSSYDPSDTSNIIINLADNVSYTSILFPNSQLLFASGSGQFANYQLGLDKVTVKNTQSNEQKTIQINKYGVVTNVN